MDLWEGFCGLGHIEAWRDESLEGFWSVYILGDPDRTEIIQDISEVLQFFWHSRTASV